MSKTRVIYLGVSNEYRELGQKREAKGSINFCKHNIISVSALERHKNFETLIEAYSNLDECIRRCYKLVIIGNINGRYAHYYQELVDVSKEFGVVEHVVFTGHVPFEQLLELYKGAAVFVFPSLAEGFGLPLVEAMAAGVPVLASDAPVFAEVAGDAGLVFSAQDPKDLQSKLQLILEDVDLQASFVQKGLERSQLFSWRRCAEETLAVFQEAIRRRG